MFDSCLLTMLRAKLEGFETNGNWRLWIIAA